MDIDILSDSTWDFQPLLSEPDKEALWSASFMAKWRLEWKEIQNHEIIPLQNG